MSAPTFAEPETIGFDPARLEWAYGLLEARARDGTVTASAVCVGRKAGVVAPRFFGRAAPGSLFLVASLTKPVTATAVMVLVERGALGLDDRVAEFLPGFGQNGKQGVRLRHLLTHTSGLPDMVPNDRALRAAHAPLSRFVEAVDPLPLAFEPGTRVRYQSAGFAVLGEVVRRVTGDPLAGFLRREVFDPLGMADTSLGCDGEAAARVAAVRLEPEQRGTDWNWNTAYWLGFGAPWGGLVTSPADFARFCRLMLRGGELDGVRVLSPASVRAATRNQLAGMPDVPEADRRCRPWGLGWRLAWPGHSAHFGDLLGPRAFGHWGATGTLCWVDPDADAFAVVLTNEPAGDDGRHLARVSDALAAAAV